MAYEVGTTVVIDDSINVSNIVSTSATTINVASEMVVPTGTTAQRPGSPASGSVRYNTTTSKLEIYTGSTWSEL